MAAADQPPHHIGALGNLGVVYSRTNRPAKAIEVYKRALRLAPKDKGLILNLGLAYLKLDDHTRALPLFRELAPSSARLVSCWQPVRSTPASWMRRSGRWSRCR